MALFARSHHGLLCCYHMNPACSVILYQRIDLQSDSFEFFYFKISADIWN
jgi:hypothetical protein